MTRALSALATSLWLGALTFILWGPIKPGMPGLLTGAAVTATVCATLRVHGLSDRELVALAVRAGPSMQIDAHRAEL